MLRRALSLMAAVVGIMLAFGGPSVLAEPPWKVLPKMPQLPAAGAVSGPEPVHVNDIERWRAEFGPPNGRSVVMVHGGLADANYFGRVIPYLVDAGSHVVAVDSCGHGRSTQPTQP